MEKRRWPWLMAATIVVVGALLGWYLRQPEVRNPYSGQFSDDLAKSTDLERDLELMWGTQPLSGTPDPSRGPDPRASTDEAIEAGSRVFNTVELVGKSRGEVIGLLGDPRASNDSIYNFPFWPAPDGAMVYRFDTGAYGWQFNLLLDSNGVVEEVQRAWIH